MTFIRIIIIYRTTFNQVIVTYKTTFIRIIVIYTTGIFSSLQSFNMYTDTSYNIYLYMALPLAINPLANPRFYLLGTLQL